MGVWEGKRPGVDIFERGEDGLALLFLLLQEALQVQELGSEDLVLEMGQPALVEGVDFELQEVSLLIRQLGDPFLLVELGRRRWRGR